jgi:hypothetical protein
MLITIIIISCIIPEITHSMNTYNLVFPHFMFAETNNNTNNKT